MTISTNCTVLAMTTMKVISRRYGAWGSTKLLRNHEAIEVMIITKMLARPRRNAVSSRPVTPKNGQRPRK